MKKLLLLIALTVSFQSLADQPKLVLQLTVDQLRGDLLNRYKDNFINKRNQKGFQRFLSQGTLFTNAHYRHAATLTAVGHATLATGAIPSQHGLIGNNWYDVATQSPMYCVADAETHMVGGDGMSASPANLMASTFSDQLHLATAGKAKIFSVSVKDRGAVLIGGHFGKSFWKNKNTGDFVTSSYYYDEMPEWAANFNTSGLKDKFLGSSWTLSQPESRYHNSKASQLYQIPPKGFSRGFPHKLPDEPGKAYYRALNVTPHADWITAEFAKEIVTQHDLGQDDITDYLAISFSITDYVGHNFGPNSREAEDNLYHLDKTLADLFGFLDKKIGLEDVLIVLSADHGVDAIPEYKKSIGFAGFRGDVAGKFTKYVAQYAKEKGMSESPLFAVKMPNVYLNHQKIKEAGLDSDAMVTDFKDYLESLPELYRAYSKSELMAGIASPSPITQKIINNFVSDRSGDLVLVQHPSTMTANYSSATHGSPYNYDTHVPVYFAGWKVQPKRITRLTSPEDVAVTLSATLNIGYPDKATGTVLPEIAELQ